MPKKSNSKKSTRKNEIERMKMEIADDFGVNLGADSTSRDNGSVGGEMTRRLVQMARKSECSGSNSTSRSSSNNKKRKNK